MNSGENLLGRCEVLPMTERPEDPYRDGSQSTMWGGWCKFCGTMYFIVETIDGDAFHFLNSPWIPKNGGRCSGNNI